MKEIRTITKIALLPQEDIIEVGQPTVIWIGPGEDPSLGPGWYADALSEDKPYHYDGKVVRRFTTYQEYLDDPNAEYGYVIIEEKVTKYPVQKYDSIKSNIK